MNYIGGIEGMNFTPIANFNNYLKNNKFLEIDSNGDFENILNQQSAAIQNPIQGGVQMNNFDEVAAQNSVQTVSETSPTGNFIQSFSNSVDKGLNSVNDSIQAANKAQEAFATGENVSVHDVMIASEKANLNLQLAMQIRNKLMSAYNEINNVRV